MNKNKFTAGARYLVCKPFPNDQSTMTEVTVLEVSPSGERIKFRFPGGGDLWLSANHFEIVEVLQSCGAKAWV